MEAGPSETRASSSPSHPLDPGGFAPGHILADRYRIVALVGRGGMGEVYRADDLKLGQPVALKFLPAELERDPSARDRLLAEVRSARTVSHPNVCRVYDVGDIGGRVFLTMEYIDGEDLASLLRRIGRLPAAKALEIARQLCAGLAAAHDKGVLHRDLKPANVMIDGRGQARITDFGLAVNAQAGESLSDFAGTLQYMAPERFRGTPATVQSDLYALGLILYETYTGKPAFKADSIREWERAHSDSTPTNPSALATDVEPGVERAILRCLEKEPAKRPASAAQVAAALPGGDPLTAALAAGETPSPELVAASGEEGTLPRRQAWLWFGSSLVALVLAVTLGSLWQLANLVALNDPTLQRGTARQILASLGYPNSPVDYASSYETDDNYLTKLVETRPARAWFSEPGQAWPGALRFCYRESPVPLFTWSPFGTVSVFDPPPRYPDDIYVELDGRGRLATLRVGGLRFRPSEATSSRPTDWDGLFAAAGLDHTAFKEASVEWPAVFTADESRAWEGRLDEHPVRVEASAYRGRPVQFVVGSVETRPRDRPSPTGGREGALDTLVVITNFAAVAALAILARHNLRLGRGDRKGAFRLALAVFALETVWVVFNRHWTYQPLNMLRVLIYLLGLPFSTAALIWLFYIGLEPLFRRRWPHLLIAWTRLLDGRWRDPLIGRSLLTGTVAGLVATGVVPGVLSALTRAYSLPVAVPRFAVGSLDGGAAWFLTYWEIGWVAPVHVLELMAMLLIARLALRRDRLAWMAVLAVAYGTHAWESSFSQVWFGSAPLATAILAGVISATLVAVLARAGLLAGVTFYAVTIALSQTPLTCDVTRWYAWRTGVVVTLIAGLLFWAFRNVLGRQSAFPTGALDG